MSQGIAKTPRKEMDVLNLLKILACLLITNSHCREIYPVSVLAVGGGFGNAIFFGVSGFLLAQVKTGFFPWFAKRTRRILPETLLFVLVSALVLDFGTLRTLSAWECIFLFMDKYWFVWALFLYLPVFYLLFYGKNKAPYIAALVYAVGYALLYVFTVDKSVFSVELAGFHPFKVYFYFGTFLFGGIFRKLLLEGDFDGKRRNGRARLAAIPVMLLGAGIWAITYYFVTVREMFLSLQFLIHVGTMLVLMGVMHFTNTFRDLTLPEGKFASLIRVVAGSTLEIYLLQVTVVHSIEILPFPVNAILFFTIAFVGGTLFAILWKKIFELPKKQSK